MAPPEVASAETGKVVGALRRLLPEAPALPTDARSVAAAAAGLALLTAWSLARQAGPGALDTLWAEDGDVFLQQLRDDGLAATLLRPYAGYLHLLPRLLVAAVGWLPVATLAAGVALAAALTTAALGLVTVAAARPHVRSAVLRWALGAAVVATPVVGLEVLNTVALLQWTLAATAVWVALWRPPRGWERVLLGVVLVLALSSAPLALLAVPLLAVRLRLETTWAARAAPLAGLAAALVQCATLLTAEQQPADGPMGSLATLAALWSQRVVTHAVIGVRGADVAWPALGALLPVAAVLLVGAAIVAGARRLEPRRQALVALLVLASLLAFGGSVALRGVTAGLAWPPDTAVGSGSRYAVAPVLLLLGALAVAADGAWPRGRGLVVAGLVGLLLVALVDLRLANGRAGGPSWSAAVDAAAGACARDEDGAVAVAHAPATPPGRWVINLDCEELMTSP